MGVFRAWALYTQQKGDFGMFSYPIFYTPLVRLAICEYKAFTTVKLISNNNYPM